MEADEACSETAGDGTLSPRVRERNDKHGPKGATGTRPNDVGHGTTNRGESVSVPSAISILTSLEARFKEGSFLCMDTKYEPIRRGLQGHTTDPTRDAKREAVVHIESATGSSIKIGNTRVENSNSEADTDVKSLGQTGALRFVSPLQRSRSAQQPWPTLQVALGSASAASTQTAVNCGSGGGSGPRQAACGDVGNAGNCKNNQSALEGLLFAAAAAAAGILRESSGPTSALTGLDLKEMRLLHAANSPIVQNGLRARPAPVLTSQPTQMLQVTTSASARYSARSPVAGAAASATLVTSKHIPMAPSLGAGHGVQPIGRYCGGGGAGAGLAGTINARGQRVQQQQQQLLPGHHRQASDGNGEEVWREPLHQSRPPVPPHTGAAVGSGASGMARSSAAQFACSSGVATVGTGASAGTISAPCNGAVRSKGVLSPKVPIIMPRQFAERVMDPAMILKHGITVVVRRIRPLPPGAAQPLHTLPGTTAAIPTTTAAATPPKAEARNGRSENGGCGSDAIGSEAVGDESEGNGNADLVLTAQVEQFFHAQGYSQYRVLGLKEISCGYHNWRIEMWEALGDRTVRLTICAPPQAAKASTPLHLMGPHMSTAHRDPQGLSATGAEGGGVNGNNTCGDVACPLQRHPSSVVQTDVVKRELGLECTEEVGEDDFDDTGGGSASAAAAPLELELGRGANLLVAAAAAAGRSGRCNGGGSGVKSAAAGARRKPHTGSSIGGPYSSDGRGVAATLGVKRGAEVAAEAETGEAIGEEDPDAATPSAATPRKSFGGGCHKILRTSTGIARSVQNNGGIGGGCEHDCGPHQGLGQELGRPGRVEPGRESVWEAKIRPARRMGGGWRDTTGGGGAFGIYSSLPAEDMPPELPGALASSPHPCRKGGATVLSPDHFIHLPRLFFQDNFDTAAVLAVGLRVQVQAVTCLDPIVTTVSVASYQNHTGYRYYRLLGFKDVSRRYAGWRVAAWDKVAADMVRVRLAPPLGLPLRIALARAGQLGVKGGSTFMLSGEAAAAVSNAGGDASAAAANGQRGDYIGGPYNGGSGGAGSILPIQRRPSVGTAEGGHCFGDLSSRLPESRSDDEEDRAAGLAMMNLGWDLQKRQPQQMDTSQAETIAVAPMPAGHTGVSDAYGGGTVVSQPPRVATVTPGGPGASFEVEIGDAVSQRLTHLDGAHPGDGGASREKGGDPESEGEGDMTGTAKVGEQRIEHATADAVTVGEDGDGAGDDLDAGGNAAGGPLAARQRLVGPLGANRGNRGPPYRRTALGHDPSLPYLLLQRSSQVTASAGSGNVVRHVAPSTAEVRRIMEAGVAAAVARLEVPASRVRSVVSQNQSVVRPDKGRVYLQKPFVESSLAITATPLSVQVVINSGGELDPATYPTKVTLSSSGAHGKAEYLLRLTAPMKHAHSGQLIVGWSAIGRQQLLMHLAASPSGRQAENSAELGKGRVRAMAGRLPAQPAPPLPRARAGGGTLTIMAADGAPDDDGRKQLAEEGKEDGRAEKTAQGGDKQECKHEVYSNACGAGEDGRDIAEKNTAEKPISSESKRCVHAQLQPVASQDAPQLEPMTASLRIPGITPSILHGIPSVQGIEGARQPSAQHSSAKAVANVSLGSQPNLGVQQISTVNQSLVAAADYHVRLFAAGWPLAAATAVTAAGVIAAASSSKLEPNANVSQALREEDQERHTGMESDGGCSPSKSPKLPAVASRRPRSSRLQRPRQGMWAHPSGPLQLVRGLPFQLHLQRHGPYHVRKPSLPDSVLNAAEQLLHLSGQVLCSGSSDEGGAAVGDGSDEDDDVYEHYGMHRGPQGPNHGEGIAWKGIGDGRFRWVADAEGASSEAGDSGGDTCGNIGEGTKAGYSGCAEEAEVTHTLQQPVTIDGGGGGCRSGSSGGDSDHQAKEFKVCGPKERRLMPSPKHMQSQLDVQWQQELHQQLHRQRRKQRQEQQREQPQATGEEGEDFRHQRADIIAARRGAIGGALPSTHNCTGLPQQQLEPFAAGESVGGTGLDTVDAVRSSTQIGHSGGGVAAGCAVNGPAVSQGLKREQDMDVVQVACPDKGPTTTLSNVVLRQPPGASVSAALATRDSSSAMPFNSMPPAATTASGARDSQQHSVQTPAGAVAAALPATDPGRSCQLGSQLSYARNALDAQQVQHLQHLHQLHQYLMGREGGRPAAAAAAVALPALSRLGFTNCGVESVRRSGPHDLEGKSPARCSGGGSSTAAAAATFTASAGQTAPADAAVRATLTGPNGKFEATAACMQRVSFSISSIDSSGGCGGMLGAMDRPHAVGMSPHLPAPSMPPQQQQQEQSEPQTLSTSPKQEQQERQNQQLKGMGSPATALLGHACKVSSTKAAESRAASALKVVAAAAEALAPSSAAARAATGHVAAELSHGDPSLTAGPDALSPSRCTADKSPLPPGLSRGVCNKRTAAVALQGADSKALGVGDDNDSAVDVINGVGGGNGCRNRRFRPASCTAGSSDCRGERELETANRDADVDMGAGVGTSDLRSGGGGGTPCKDSSCEGNQGGRPAELSSVAPRDRSNRPDRILQKQPSRGVFANTAGHAAVEVPSAFQRAPMPMPMPPSAASALGMGMQMAALGYGLPSVMYSHPHLQHLHQQHHPHPQHHQQAEQQELECPQSWQQHWHKQLQHQQKVMHQHQLMQIRRRELRKAEKHRRQMQQEQMQQPEQLLQHREDVPDHVGPDTAAAVGEEAGVGPSSQHSSPHSRLLHQQQEQQRQHDAILKQQRQKQQRAGSLEAAALRRALSKPQMKRCGPSLRPQEGKQDQSGSQQKQQEQKRLDRLSSQPCEVGVLGRNAGLSETATVPGSAPVSAADNVRAQLQALLGSSAGAFSFASVPLMLLVAQHQRQQQNLQQQHLYHHHQQSPPQQIQQNEHSQQLQEERRQKQQVFSSTSSEEKCMGSREGARPAFWGPRQTHAQSQGQTHSKAQVGQLRAQADQVNVVASTTTAGGSEATRRAAVASADNSLTAADTAAIGRYLQLLQEQLLSQQQHPEQLQERFLSQQLPFPPQQEKEQQAPDSLQKQRQQQIDAQTDAEESVEHGSAATASNFHLGLADMGPALQHLMLQSRLRQQAAEWTAAAATMAAAAMTQPRVGQPSAGHGAGPGLGSPGGAFRGLGPGA